MKLLLWIQITLASPQHVIPVRRQILPAPLSKPSPQKIIQDKNNKQMESKNLQTASILNGGQQKNQIKNVCEFIQKAMETLSTYERGKTISRATHYRDDLEGNVINLSKTILSIQQKFEFLIHDPTYEHMKIVNGTIETFHHQQVFAKSIANNL